MGKNRKPNTYDKEYSENQRLRRENDRLKKNIASLRKQIQRLDLDRYANISELIAKQDREEQADIDANALESLKKKWRCKDCGKGHLEIITFNKLNEEWYYRQCTSCANRTRAQRMHDKVSGIKKIANVDEK